MKFVVDSSDPASFPAAVSLWFECLLLLEQADREYPGLSNIPIALVFSKGDMADAMTESKLMDLFNLDECLSPSLTNKDDKKILNSHTLSLFHGESVATIDMPTKVFRWLHNELN